MESALLPTALRSALGKVFSANLCNIPVRRAAEEVAERRTPFRFVAVLV
jgi:hypothetical protein